MAAPVVTLDTPHALRLGNSQFGALSGSVNIASYDAAHPAVAGITGMFHTGGKLRVAVCGVSSNGYFVTWDPITHSFKAYVPAGSTSNPTMVVASGTPATHPLGVTGGGTGGPIVGDAAYSGATGIVAGAFAGAAGSEVAGATNVGTVDFIAIGQLGL